MARTRRDRPPSSGTRTLKLFGLNLLILGGGMLLLWVGYRVLHHPQVTAPPVAVPADLRVGTAPGPLTSGDYGLTLDGARWIAQSSLPPGLHLSFRARPGPTVDYLVLDVTVRNLGGRPIALSYVGSEQDVRLLLTSTDPVSFYAEPVPPQEAKLITRDPVFGSGPLAAGAERRGALVYAVERFRKRWALLMVPEPPDAPAAGPGPQQPALEMRLTP